MIIVMKECQHCYALETRLFIDSWTGKELCIECLAHIINHVTFDPEDGDNLESVLIEHVGSYDDEEEMAV